MFILDLFGCSVVMLSLRINFSDGYCADKKFECVDYPQASTQSFTMPVEQEMFSLTIKFWTLVVVCFYYGGTDFLWKFGIVMALIDWFVNGYVNPTYLI